MKIFRQAETRLTVAEAKNLLLENLPAEHYVEVELILNHDGQVDDVDLDTMRERFDAQVYAQGLDADFKGICAQLAIVPRLKWRPLLSTYEPGKGQDDIYTISHAEFVRLAGLYGLEVAVAIDDGADRQHVLTDDKTQVHTSLFDEWATKDELISAFGAFTGMEDSWFENVKDKPKLKAARRVPGTRSTQPMYCPFEVMKWLVDKKRKAGRPLREGKGWEILEKNFPRSYNRHSIGDPRD